jgi:16S rRNA A1518/A1519 N6-dimethyltransferase RsmA/KsgA/DIM1 with predicted DNA glycosylase/AP lyase activity
VDAAILFVVRRDPPLLGPALRRDYTAFVTAAFEGARPTVASALSRTLPRSRFTPLATELGFGVAALPSQLDVTQWVALFRASRRSAAAAPGPARRPAPRPPAAAPPPNRRRR